MKRGFSERLTLFFGLLTLVMIILLAIAPVVYAGGSSHHNDDIDVDVGGDTINVGGDTVNVQGGDLSSGPVSVSTGGNKSFALAVPGLGDVDIAGCLGSEQWTLLIGGKQKLVINWVCLTEFYLRNGEPELAAQALCNTEVIKEYETEEECESAHGFFADVVQAMVVQEEIVDTDEEEYRQEQLILYEDLQAKVRNLEEELAKPRPTPRPTIKKEVIHKGGLTDEQKKQLREVVK